MYLKSLDHSFLIAVEVLDKVLSATKPLSVRLQGEGQGLFRATESVQDRIAVLKDMRSGNTFDQLFANVETVVEEPLQMPRLVCGRYSGRHTTGILQAKPVLYIH